MRKFAAVAVLIFGLSASSGAFAAETPTNYEQYELQLLNHARANPTAEVTRLSSMTWGDDPTVVPGTAYPQPQTPDLNEGLPVNTISTAAKQPLAFNLNLIQAARDYSQTLITNNAFTHTYNNTTPQSRMTAAGYTFSGTYGNGENLAVSTSSSSSFGISTSTVEQEHDGLFVDNNVSGRGHRLNMMNASWQEIGIGVAQGSNYTYLSSSTPYGVISTQDFAYKAQNSFLTGVVFNDNVTHDNFYTPGEGVGAVTITAVLTSGGGGSFSTVTWSSGGYSLQLPAGTFAITASDPGVFAPISMGSVTIGSLNVEDDLMNVPEPMCSAAFVICTFGLLRRRRVTDRATIEMDGRLI